MMAAAARDVREQFALHITAALQLSGPISAAHSRADLQLALDAFGAVKRELGV